MSNANKDYELKLINEISSAPTPSQNRIVFKWSLVEGRFIKSKFDSTNTEYLLLKEDANQIIKRIKESDFYTPNIPHLNCWTLLISLPFIIFIVIALVLFTVDPSLIHLFCLVVILVLMAPVVYLRERCEEKREKKIYEGRQSDFQRIMQNEMREEGLGARLSCRVGKLGV